ncbi:MAG: glutamine synthetase [Porticoccaceae bacterium]|jgi:glutamine synthetase|nr:glutamine synthetase [Porticoccaceae bacterium]MBT3797362.1 glutamine synthetase [Porticoccaceae bacterium]MBT4210816.1 glutamine synthetase [Porticoccaceae bacterium]MBT4590426.1 glutamine synthetase [Porticoccaceae bacterium]MBT5003979.1 glutamine synthetase [Porticoccaceae bacterium]
MKAKLEYIWLDGTAPTQCLRSKTQVRHDFGGTLEECPMWCFDGSSTNQAEGNASDCLLKPVAIYPDPDRSNAFLVMTEVLNADGTPHVTNGRATINDDDNDFWFGFEQEYFLWDVDTQLPPGFPHGGFPAPQGPYYCSVGAANTFGRDCVEEHFDICLEAGINVEGINAEVAAGQWEFQCFAKGAKQAGDEIWVSRYLLERTGEKYGYAINYHPKPLGDTDWNGSGMHANFSNGAMRDLGDEAIFTKICEEFGKNIERHISVYGADNDQRLTGKHETQSIDEFSYGVSDRGASIRIPVGTVEDGWKGRLEDRRTSSNADPYKVAAAIIKTTKEALA